MEPTCVWLILWIFNSVVSVLNTDWLHRKWKKQVDILEMKLETSNKTNMDSAGSLISQGLHAGIIESAFCVEHRLYPSISALGFPAEDFITFPQTLHWKQCLVAFISSASVRNSASNIPGNLTWALSVFSWLPALALAAQNVVTQEGRIRRVPQRILVVRRCAVRYSRYWGGGGEHSSVYCSSQLICPI